MFSVHAAVPLLWLVKRGSISSHNNRDIVLAIERRVRYAECGDRDGSLMVPRGRSGRGRGSTMTSSYGLQFPTEHGAPWGTYIALRAV